MGFQFLYSRSIVPWFNAYCLYLSRLAFKQYKLSSPAPIVTEVIIDYQGRAEMRLIWGESFSSSTMMSCKNMCIMKKAIDKCDYVWDFPFSAKSVLCARLTLIPIDLL